MLLYEAAHFSCQSDRSPLPSIHVPIGAWTGKMLEHGVRTVLYTLEGDYGIEVEVTLIGQRKFIRKFAFLLCNLSCYYLHIHCSLIVILISPLLQ